MGVGLTMLSLTKAQRDLVEKCKSGPVHPYGGQWQTFYRLKQAGVMQYVSPNIRNDIELTADARRHLGI